MTNYYIKQSININIIKINAIANSSVLQIGSTGMIKSHSVMSNTGAFTQEAPPAVHPANPVNPDIPQVIELNRGKE